MENWDIELNETQMVVALTKLLSDLFQKTSPQDSNNETLWDFVEQLDAATFSLLHKNVYFADFLRQISVKSRKIHLAENEIEQHQDVSLVNGFQSEPIVPSQKIEIQAELCEDTFVVPNLATPLDVIKLPDRFLKLIKRLRNASLNNIQFSLGHTLQDLVDLTVEEVNSLNGVGISYSNILVELKERVTAQHGNFPEIENTISDTFDFSVIDTSNYLISMSGVDQSFIKPLAKYVRHFKLPDMTQQIDSILKFERDNLLSLPAFGIGVVDKLMEFKNIIEAEIRAIELGEVDYMSLQSKIIVPSVIGSMTLKQIEQVLLDDIDNFLDKSPDEDVDIAQHRWGFVEEKETLEEVGLRFGVTRERIRQKEVVINNNLSLNLRINPKLLWDLLEPHMQPALKEQISDFFNCFSSEKAFYEFLEIVCQQEKLFEYVYPEIDKMILNAYFAENGAPIHIQDAFDIIGEAGLVNAKNINNAILNLQKKGALVVEGDFIWPKYLGKSEASACVLVNHPKGLPWSDIAKLVNSNAFSRTEIYEDRVDIEAFKHKDYIYLAGKGLYKHTRFINSDVINLEKIFAELLTYSTNIKREVFHLNECYQASSYLNQFDYYEIRHFVKHFGEDYGYYFDGRSQSDSVGLEKGFKNITQKDVIIEAMNAREKPLTKPEVASLLKSKSLGHASFYLDGLMEEAKVVQVDHRLYTTPERAYRNIELPIYLNAMQSILDKCARPVEASIFQEIINPLLSVGYSKYFYASIARCFATERGWYRAHGLYSIQPIPFHNLTDVLNTYCGVDDPVKDSVERLQQHIAITKDNASRIIHNWRNANVS